MHESKFSSFLKLHWSSYFSIECLAKAAFVDRIDVIRIDPSVN